MGLGAVKVLFVLKLLFTEFKGTTAARVSLILYMVLPFPDSTTTLSLGEDFLANERIFNLPSALVGRLENRSDGMNLENAVFLLTDLVA